MKTGAHHKSLPGVITACIDLTGLMLDDPGNEELITSAWICALEQSRCEFSSSNGAHGPFGSCLVCRTFREL